MTETDRSTFTGFLTGIFIALLIMVFAIVATGVNTCNHPPHYTCHNICDGQAHCKISEDAVIDNRVLSLYDNSTLDLIKDDAYTRGMIDGRHSILEEQSNTGYKSDYLGVQSEYEPLPYPQWRQYANCIARNECAYSDIYQDYLYPMHTVRNITNFDVGTIPENATTAAVVINYWDEDGYLYSEDKNGTFIDENLTWYYVREGAGKVNYSIDYVTCDCDPYCNHNGIVPPYCLYNNGEYP